MRVFAQWPSGQGQGVGHKGTHKEAICRFKLGTKRVSALSGLDMSGALSATNPHHQPHRSELLSRGRRSGN